MTTWKVITSPRSIFAAASEYSKAQHKFAEVLWGSPVDPDCPFQTGAIMQQSEHFTEHTQKGDFPQLGQTPALKERKGAFPNITA